MLNLALTVLFLSAPAAIDAKLWRNKGKKEGAICKNQFIFVGKFAYGYDKTGAAVGASEFESLSIDSQYYAQANAAGYEMYLFDDENYSWPSIYNKANLTCADLNAATPDTPEQLVFNSNGTVSLSFFNRIRQKLRSRFWYVALAACGANAPEGASCTVEPKWTWELHMYRLEVSDWNKEFGMDQKGLNTIYLVFFFIYTLLLLVQGFASHRFKSSMGYVHPLVKGFTLIIFLEWVYCLFMTIHFCVSANNGVGVPFFEVAGEMVEIIPRACFILLLLLLASGWLISYTGEIKKKALIFGVTFALLGCFITNLIWGYASYKPDAVDITESLKVFSYGFIFFWLVVAFFFCVTVFLSFRREDNPSKEVLYFRMLILYGFWFLGVPFVNMLALLLDPWVRERLIAIFSLVVTIVGIVFMIFLLDPSRAEDYFDMSKRSAGAAVTAVAWERL